VPATCQAEGEKIPFNLLSVLYLFFRLAAAKLRTGIRKVSCLPLTDKPKHIL